MSHASATLTPITRLRLAVLIVEDGWTHATAKLFVISPKTAKKWAVRCRTEGPVGMGESAWVWFLVVSLSGGRLVG